MYYCAFYRLGILTGALALCLIGGGCGSRAANDLGDFARRLYDMGTGNTVTSNARKMEDQYFPDERRDGINRLAARPFGRQAPYTERYEQIAQTDRDYLVRATAIRALNVSRDTSATEIFVRALVAPEVQVRLEAAKALANMPDESAIPRLLRLAEDKNENRDVRVAAVDALRHYRKPEVARTLIGLLNQRDFTVAWQARQSLRTLTGRDLQYDEAAWLALLTGPDNPLS